MRVMHIITSLETGGAQSALIQLIKQLKAHGFDQSVISMKPGGEQASIITVLGIPVHEVRFSPGTLIRSRDVCERIILDFQPDIIQSWLYHADFLTILLRKPNQIPVFWGLHHSYESTRKNLLKVSTKIISHINAFFSRSVPQKIICCSRSALESHVVIGYAETKMVFIPNGIDSDQFKPDINARIELRSKLGLSPKTPLIGYIARYHPQKDHGTFFTAAALLLDKKPETHFLLAGNNVVPENPDIQKYLHPLERSSHFHLLGRRVDIPMITAGLDIATLSSSGGEAFPLTILEAMACGIPSVATNVGDIMEVIGPCGVIVPPRNPRMLAQGWIDILNMSPEERADLGKVSRDRVEMFFTDQVMADKYIGVYKGLND